MYEIIVAKISNPVDKLKKPLMDTKLRRKKKRKKQHTQNKNEILY